MVLRARKRERDRVAIVAEILEMSRDGELKSNIMWKAGLSYLMLSGYLKLMTTSGLLDESEMNNKTVFRTSERGLRFIHYCNEITELLKIDNVETKLYDRIRLLPPALPA